MPPDSILELDPNADPADLANQIVTLPNGTDMGSDCVGKLGRVLLTGKPEERNPAKYAQAFALVRQDARATAWMRFAAWAQQLNGERRITGADMSAIARDLGELAVQAADQIPSGNPKFLLLGDVAYNRGIVNRGLRRYDDEELSQRESAAWFALAGNRAKSDTSLFAAQVGVVSAALVSGSSARIHMSIEALVAARDFVFCQDYPYPAWMGDNAHLHPGFERS